MSARATALLAALPVLLCSGAVRAADHHVATTGDDSAAGSDTAPFLTIRHALDVAGPGDTIYVHTGTYVEEINTYNGAIRGGSSWADPLTIASFASDTVVLRAPSGSARVVTFADASASYVIVRGFVMDARDAIYDGVKITWSGTLESNTSHHIRIEDCEVMGSPGEGVLVGGHDNEFLRLRVHDNGLTDFHHGFYIASPDNLIEGCEVYRNAGWGVQVYHFDANDADRNIVRNNWIHDNARAGARGPGMVIASGEENLAFNNVIFGNNGGIHVDYGAVHARVYNNTVFANAAPGIFIGSGSTNADVRNNLVFDNSGGIDDVGVGTTMGVNLVDGTPGVVDAATFDVHLLATSPAVDTGEALADVLYDYDRVPRPQGVGYDVGAFEHYRGGPDAGVGPVTDAGGAAVPDGGAPSADSGGMPDAGAADGGARRDAMLALDASATAPASDDGCGCLVAGGARNAPGAGLGCAMVVLAALALRRRRRA